MDNSTDIENYTSTSLGNGNNSSNGTGLFVVLGMPDWLLPVELTMMVAVFVLGVPGNALIVTIQYMNKSKTSTDYLVMVMAVYELLGSVFSTTLDTIHGNDVAMDVLGSDFMCQLVPWFYYLCQYGSSLTLCALAVDRCVKTVSPFSRWYSERLAKIISVCILLLALVVGSSQVIYIYWDRDISRCIVHLADYAIVQWIGNAGSVLELIQFCTISVSYILIAIALRRRHLKKLRQRMSNNARTTFSDVTSSVGDVSTSNTCSTTLGTASETDQTNVVSQKQVNSGETVGVKKSGASKERSSKMLTLEGKHVNKLTALMFFVSLFYIATKSIKWYLYITHPFALGFGLLDLSFTIPLLNCISNPIMFFSMSSRFRTNVKTLLCVHGHK